jgi:hypothetical protein
VHTRWIYALVPAAVLAVGCSRGSDKPFALNDDLKKDVDRAAAPVSELASVRYAPHFLNPDEITPKVAITKQKVATHKGAIPAAAVAAPQPVTPVAPQVVAQANAGSSVIRIGGNAPQPSLSDAPAAGPRATPQPLPTVGGIGVADAGRGHDGGWGGDGVVLRGGWPGDDNCAPGHGGIAVNTMMPHMSFPH